MPELVNISGSAWPSSGSATTVTTGLAAVSGLTHVASQDVPAGSSATGYLTATKNTIASFTVGATNTFFQGGQTRATLRFFIRAVRDRDDAFAADASYSGGSSGNRMMAISASGTKYGIPLRVVNFAFSGASTAHSEGFTDNAFGGTTTTYNRSYGIIPLIDDTQTGGWVELCWHIYSNGANSTVEFFVNGVKTHDHTGVDLSVGFTNTNFPITLHPFAGTTFQVCGPMECWGGDDVVIRPKYEQEDSTSYIEKAFPVLFSNSTRGGIWTTSGTATATETEYASSGINPYRKRYVITGTSTQTHTQKTIDDIGTPSYTEGGIATIAFPMIYLPSGGTASFRLRNTADDDDLIKIDYDGTKFVQGSTTLVTIANTRRMSLYVHLDANGGATYTIHDMTSAPATQCIYSGELENWDAGEIGKCQVDVVLGSADCEMDGIYLARRLWFLGMDSFVHAAVNGVTPQMAGLSSRIAGRFTDGSGGTIIPNGSRTFHWITNSKRAWAIPMGYTGNSFESVYDALIQHMTYTRGVEYVFVNGAGPNGMSGISTQTDVDNFVTEYETNLKATVNLMTSLGNKVVLCTQIRNEQGTYSDLQLQAMQRCANIVREVAKTQQAGGLVRLSDTAVKVGDHDSLFTAGDDTHPNSEGCTTLARLMLEEQVTVNKLHERYNEGKRLTL